MCSNSELQSWWERFSCLQVRILRLLRILGHNDETASDTMNDLLAQVRRSRSCRKLPRLTIAEIKAGI